MFGLDLKIIFDSCNYLSEFVRNTPIVSVRFLKSILINISWFHRAYAGLQASVPVSHANHLHSIHSRGPFYDFPKSREHRIIHAILNLMNENNSIFAGYQRHRKSCSSHHYLTDNRQRSELFQSNITPSHSTSTYDIRFYFIQTWIDYLKSMSDLISLILCPNLSLSVLHLGLG